MLRKKYFSSQQNFLVVETNTQKKNNQKEETNWEKKLQKEKKIKQSALEGENIALGEENKALRWGNNCLMNDGKGKH